MSSHGGPSRKNMSQSRSSLYGKKKAAENGASDAPKKSLAASRSKAQSGERTVKRLRLSKALTISETTSISAACHRMAARRVDALLLTDSKALLCGILTDKDIATRVIAQEMDIENTPVSKVMTRNPIFVLSDTLAVDALQRMVQGKFRHLPVVENGEVIALLDITKCLYDAISRMERAAEKGMAIAAAVEGVDKQWGASSPNNFIEAIREKLFMPSLSTIISENSKIVTVMPSDTILIVAKKMLEFRTSSVVATVENKPCGILTSRDILMRVIAQNLDPGCTLVEKVMTPNPECATVDTPIVDALHLMNDGKFLHLPIVDRDGIGVAVIDVLHITHAAIATVGNTGGVVNESGSNMMQRFWDSAMGSGPLDDDTDTRSDGSFKLAASETAEFTCTYPAASLSNIFSFKIQDLRGQMHRFNCDTRSLSGLLTAILHRLDSDIERKKLPHILYEDEEHDKVILASDADLAAAVDLARSANWKHLRLYLDYPEMASGCGEFEVLQSNAWAAAYKAVAAGAALAAGLGFLAYLKRSSFS